MTFNCQDHLNVTLLKQAQSASTFSFTKRRTKKEPRGTRPSSFDLMVCAKPLHPQCFLNSCLYLVGFEFGEGSVAQPIEGCPATASASRRRASEVCSIVIPFPALVPLSPRAVVEVMLLGASKLGRDHTHPVRQGSFVPTRLMGKPISQALS